MLDRLESEGIHGDNVFVDAGVEALRHGLLAASAKRYVKRQQVFVARMGAHRFGRLLAVVEQRQQIIGLQF